MERCFQLLPPALPGLQRPSRNEGASTAFTLGSFAEILKKRKSAWVRVIAGAVASAYITQLVADVWGTTPAQASGLPYRFMSFPKARSYIRH
jgi:hypothetical protein